MPGALKWVRTDAVGFDFEMFDTDRSGEQYYCVTVSGGIAFQWLAMAEICWRRVYESTIQAGSRWLVLSFR